VLDAEESGQDWLILSRGERQSRDYIRKLKRIVNVVDSSLVALGHESIKGVETTMAVTLKNGAAIMGLPANPDTARGFSGNLVLDEFAFHESPDDIWRAVFPIITNPLSGEKKVRIMSTPGGKNNRFYDLWTSKELAWSRHRTDIYDAQKAGLFTAQQVEDLKSALSDPDGWSQEFELNFLEEATQYFSRALVESCIDPRATTEGALSTVHALGPRYAGLDIGRKHDLTVMCCVQRLDRQLIVEEVLVLRQVPFDAQQKLVGERMPFLTHLAVDSSGMGEETGERLQTRWGESKVEPCVFTNAFKAIIFPGLKNAMEKGELKIPNDPKLIADLLTIEKQVTQGGTVRYVAARTEDGHADIANALALAVYSGKVETGAITSQSAREILLPPPSPFGVPRITF
jgi:phage FluMu gp28-like protein